MSLLSAYSKGLPSYSAGFMTPTVSRWSQCWERWSLETGSPTSIWWRASVSSLIRWVTFTFFWNPRYFQTFPVFCRTKHPVLLFWQEEFKGMIEDAGFCRVKYYNLTGGVVAIHSGFKLWDERSLLVPSWLNIHWPLSRRCTTDCPPGSRTWWLLYVFAGPLICSAPRGTQG